jgi:hypothetical protein
MFPYRTVIVGAHKGRPYGNWAIVGAALVAAPPGCPR